MFFSRYSIRFFVNFFKIIQKNIWLWWVFHMSFPLQSIIPCSGKLTNHKINVIIYNFYVFLSMSLSLSFPRFTLIFCMLLFLIVNKAAMRLQAFVTNEYSDVALIWNFFTQLKIQHSFKELCFSLGLLINVNCIGQIQK